MDVEVNVKKRGRPKKADGTAKGNNIKSSGPKRTSKVEPAADNYVVPITTTKKATRRKQVVFEDSNDSIVEIDDSSSTTPIKTRSKSIASKSPILEAATAFSIQSNTATHQTDQVNAHEGSKSSHEPPPNSRADLNPKCDSNLLGKVANTTVSSPEPTEEQLLEATPKPSNPRVKSSFLDDFLSNEPEPGPVVTEQSMISDRSAFYSNSIPVDDIVTGAGVSDISSFPKAQPADSTKLRKAGSSIPVTVPKVFKAHALDRFPDRPESSKPRSTDPTAFSVKSFASLISKDNDRNLRDTTSNGEAAPTSTISPAIASSSKINEQQPSFVPEKTQKVEPNTARGPAPANTSSPKPPRTSPSLNPNASHMNEPRPPPRRPTEMSQAELLKDPKFRSMRRKYTGLIVGIPVLVVTSYILWKRLDTQEGVSPSEILIEDVKRTRGVHPRYTVEDKSSKER